MRWPVAAISTWVNLPPTYMVSPICAIAATRMLVWLNESPV